MLNSVSIQLQGCYIHDIVHVQYKAREAAVVCKQPVLKWCVLTQDSGWV